jgi:aerobic-type carbon monoxide dehydrogenase small subunit (CoxS/CutS family)
MTDVTIIVDGVPRRVPGDVTLAVALLGLKLSAFRRDLGGALRGPLCGIGTCHECRVMVDGEAGVRACITGVRDGAVVETGR